MYAWILCFIDLAQTTKYAGCMFEKKYPDFAMIGLDLAATRASQEYAEEYSGN